MIRTIIIAEAGVNHNGDFNTAVKLIKAAALTGADYVKFQAFKANTLLAKNTPKAEYQLESTDTEESQHTMISRLELSESNHVKLKEICREEGIGFLSSPFDLDSLRFLHSLSMDYMKIPSGELTNRILLEFAAKGPSPIILSTGMAKMDEIGDAIEVLQNGGKSIEDIIVLHCNTEYPTPMEDVNLRAVNSIAKKWGVKVGYSDHTIGSSVPVSAVARGAMMIEKHLTLDKDLPGPDHAASMEPGDFKIMVNMIREVEQALGSKLKTPSSSEIKNIPIARKSIHYKKNLQRGHKLTIDDLIMLRPGDGISPMLYPDFLGKELNRDVLASSKLLRKDIL